MSLYLDLVPGDGEWLVDDVEVDGLVPVLQLEYLPDLSRVRITASGQEPGYVTVERSTDGIRWQPVRGGRGVEVVGGQVRLDDYEFAPDVRNDYRIREAVNVQLDDPPANQVWGRPWTVPAGIRSLTAHLWGAGGSGWASYTSASAGSGGGGGAYAGRQLTTLPGETLRVRVGAPGGPGVDGGTTAIIRDGLLLAAAAGGGGASAGVAGVGGSAAASLGDEARSGGAGGVRQGSATAGGGGGGSATAAAAGSAGAAGASGVGGAGGAGEGAGGAGGDTGGSGAAGEAPGAGGGGRGGDNPGAVAGLGAPGRIVLRSWPDGTTVQHHITPSLGQVWLKSPRWPSLNRPVRVLDRGEVVTRSARIGIHNVKGRAAPIAVHDARRARAFDLSVITTADHRAQADHLELMAAVGGTLLVHVPPESAVPGGYVAVGELAVERLYRANPDAPRVVTLPCQVVAPPAPDVAGATITCADVVQMWATCADLAAEVDTCADLVEMVVLPEEPL